MTPFMWHACQGKSQRSDPRLGAARAAPRGTGRFRAWWGCAVSWYLCLLHNCVYSSKLREVYTKEWISLYVNCVLIFNKKKMWPLLGGKMSWLKTNQIKDNFRKYFFKCHMFIFSPTSIHPYSYTLPNYTFSNVLIQNSHIVEIKANWKGDISPQHKIKLWSWYV